MDTYQRLTEYSSDMSIEGADKSVYRDKYSHRCNTFSKLDVELVEKQAVKEMLAPVEEGQSPEDVLSYAPTFYSRARVFFPEKFPVFKKSRKTNIYFIEDIGKHLWHRWNDIEDKDSDEAMEARNNLITYSYPLIDGVIFKYQRHKHMPYDEIFQSAILKLISAIPKFNPQRVVGQTETGNPIFARIYTFLVLSLNFGITHITMTHGRYKLRNSSYDSLADAVGCIDGYTNAGSVYAEFMTSLDSILAEDPLDIPEFTANDLKVFTKLRALVQSEEDVARLSANLHYVLRIETGLKRQEILDAMSRLATYMGPLKIEAASISYGTLDSDTLYSCQFS